MNLKHFLTASLFMAFLGSSLLAQGRFCHPHALEFTDEIKTMLNISPEQAEQLDEIQKNTRNQMVDLHQNPDFTHQELQKQRKLIIGQKRSSLKEILTIKQGQQLHQYKKEQARNHREAWAKVDRKAMHKEINQYSQDNIKPIMQVQRQKLGSNLTAVEISSLANIKNQIQAVRKEANAKKTSKNTERRPVKSDPQHRKEQSPSRKQGHPSPCHNGNTLMNWLHLNQDAYATLQAIIDNHQVQIDELFKETTSKREQWKIARKTIFEKYAPKEEAFRHKPMNSGEKLHAIHQAKQKEAAVMRFLLKE